VPEISRVERDDGSGEVDVEASGTSLVATFCQGEVGSGVNENGRELNLLGVVGDLTTVPGRPKRFQNGTHTPGDGMAHRWEGTAVGQFGPAKLNKLTLLAVAWQAWGPGTLCTDELELLDAPAIEVNRSTM
jgi:hypothetical protein